MFFFLFSVVTESAFLPDFLQVLVWVSWGHHRKLSHSSSVRCGWSSRDFSVLIQEFLKSLTLWVPEAFLYMSFVPLLALQWLPSTESQCSLQVDLIPIHLAVHAVSLLVLLLSHPSPSQLILTGFSFSPMWQAFLFRLLI